MTEAAEYVAHLAKDNAGTYTACGELWQGWQAPSDLDLRDPKASTVPPNSPPRAHIDRIRFCKACQQMTLSGTAR